MEKKIGAKKCLFRSEKSIGPARAGKKFFEKIRLDELPARHPDRTGPARVAGTGLGYCGILAYTFRFSGNISQLLSTPPDRKGSRARCRIPGCRAGFSIIPGPAWLPGPGAGYLATGPAKKTKKIEKKNLGSEKSI